MQENSKNILIAATLSLLVLVGWTWLYEKPRIEREELQRKARQIKIDEKSSRASELGQEKYRNISRSKSANSISGPKNESVISLKSRKEILESSDKNRIFIKSDSLQGSIFLKGARFDDLSLANYYKTAEKKEEVVLFAPARSKNRYFADFGWVSSDSSLDLPNPDTIWKSDYRVLTPQKPINLYWKNRQNIRFEIEISMDKNFMFFIKQKVKNLSNKNYTIANYGRINRSMGDIKKQNYILHEGFLGEFNNKLEEYDYEDAIDDGNKTFDSTGSIWLGITDKYWLSSIIPDEKYDYQSTFSFKNSNRNKIFNSEFITQEFRLDKKSEISFNHKLFAGAKKVKLIDDYAKEYNIRLFDRAIDFGWFYFLTKPFFFAIDFLHKFLGNFGLAILVMTIFVKLALFPMANKSYRAIAKMKKLQPKIVEIRKKNKGNKVEMNRAMMDLYKREKVNPASGCLPILVQIPIFFSLYKVIFVTLDMRHAPFYGWINDLSAPDPTSIFNLFGLLPFEVGGVFAIGIWPILMGITMVLQQKLSPPVADPTQAKVMKFLPFILTFVLASFPAGLVIYWTWNNLLSIIQQYYITKKVDS